jgi:hypothetical protein
MTSRLPIRDHNESSGREQHAEPQGTAFTFLPNGLVSCVSAAVFVGCDKDLGESRLQTIPF